MAADSRSDEPGGSYQLTRERFDQPSAAALYATRHGGHARDRREQACIERALESVPRGARVLDLPCGAGRLAPMLVRMGFDLTEADNSPHMVEQAQSAWRQTCADEAQDESGVKFEVRDVMRTGYPDGAFDAVICNRLLHHFVESSTRVAALRELARITRGALIVSFFNSFAYDAMTFRLKNWLRGRVPHDRIPIAMSEFLVDAAAAGLTLERAFPTRWGISPQWYVRLRRR
ncbi:MAG: class I SAM-dependent methyltransferase [Tepidisphaeraceae bacterium]